MTKERKQLLVFGYGLALILSFIAARLFLKYGWGLTNGLLLCVAFLLILLTRFKLDWIKIIYIRWMRVAHVIGTILTSLIMIVLFYFLFTPVGILLRLMRKDFLNRKIEPQAQTYWHLRAQDTFDKGRYSKQF